MFCVTLRICIRRIAASRPYNTAQNIATLFLRDGVLWFLVVTCPSFFLSFPSQPFAWLT
jgi:hypothetical protein